MEETANTDRKVKYDLLFILSPLLTEERAIEETGKIIKVIEAHGGKVFHSEMPKLRPLSYVVKKTWEGKKSIYDQGMSGSLQFEVDSTEIPAIKREFEAFPHLLRSAITYAYLEVRPIRRIPASDDMGEANATPSLPPELIAIPTTKSPVTEGDKADTPKKVMSEAEIDKQIEDLLS